MDGRWAACYPKFALGWEKKTGERGGKLGLAFYWHRKGKFVEVTPCGKQQSCAVQRQRICCPVKLQWALNGCHLFCSIAAVTPRLFAVSGRAQSANHSRKPAGSFASGGPAAWPFKEARLVSSE